MESKINKEKLESLKPALRQNTLQLSNRKKLNLRI